MYVENEGVVQCQQPNFAHSSVVLQTDTAKQHRDSCDGDIYTEPN